MDLVLKEESYKVMGACFEVYKEKGCGFLEAVYQECLEHELCKRAVPFKSQAPLFLNYKGHRLRQCYIADFICYGKIIVEIKSVKTLADEHRAQTVNYLKATGFTLALLVNFGHCPSIEYQRFLNTK